MSNTVPSDSPIDTHVLIAGGGMAALSLATALGQAGVPTIVIEQQQLDVLANEPDGRALAITPASRFFLKNLDAWDAMTPRGTIAEIEVNDNHAPRFLHFDALDNGAIMGNIVESYLVRSSLTATARQHASVTIIEHCHIEAIDQHHDHIVATLSNGQQIRSILLVGAEGRRSQVRRWAKIQCTTWDYGQTAFVFNIHQSQPHNNIAIELFRDSGPFALLPLDEPQKGGIVFCAFHHEAERLKAMSNTEFEAELNRITDGKIGHITLASERWAFPLSWQWAHRMIDTRIALIGDAAHGMHPIAGQGINMGFKDSAQLAEQIIAAYQAEADVGSTQLLKQYQANRRFDNLQMMLATDALVKLFCSKMPPIPFARQVGLGIMHRLPWAKSKFVQHAMGISTNLPKSMQPF